MKVEVLDALVAAGCTAEQIASAVKADQISEEKKAADRRAAAAERQRNRRIRIAASRDVTVTERDTALHGVTSCDPLSPPSPPKEVSPYNPLQEITPSSSSITDARKRANDFPTDGFAQVWSRYPRREGKQAASRKFDVVRSSGKVPFAKLLSAVERYADHCRTVEPQFVKHLATWLHGGCWDDELVPRSAGPPRGAGPQGFESLFPTHPEPENGTEPRTEFDLDLTADRIDRPASIR